VSGNVIIQERLRKIGRESAERAVSLGCTGPVLRASGKEKGPGPLKALRVLDPFLFHGENGVDSNPQKQ
jgi:NADH-quinone oxidoreductase subunit D/NADH-quinone oxidoreductase subunit C/D